MVNLHDDPDVFHIDRNIHLAKMLNEPYAYFGMMTEYHQFVSMTCGVSRLEETVTYWPDALAFQQNSVYKQMFDSV